jgi:hypothetical protein
MNFVKLALENGGIIKPLLIRSKDLKGPALANPSVLYVNDKIYVNIRNLNYTLYHAEKSRFEHMYGPLSYIHPENDATLTTNNILCELDELLDIKTYHFIDTSTLDKKPLWTFIGLEDVRLIFWDYKFYACGVRRDTTPNGQGRMELSQLDITLSGVKETSRFRIPAPGKDNSYCEKNWMPVLDQPFTFVKWSNPIEVAKADPINKICETIHLGEYTSGYKDWRGGSQVVPFGNNYITIIHETDLYKTETQKKNATYRHRFIVWDKNWKRIGMSDPFSFMGANIEFCCGMAPYNEDLLITFGYQDNASYILKVSQKVVENIIHG